MNKQPVIFAIALAVVLIGGTMLGFGMASDGLVLSLTGLVLALSGASVMGRFVDLKGDRNDD